jgi:hypothetical protein
VVAVGSVAGDGSGGRATKYQVADAPELRDRAVGHIRGEGLAVPIELVLDLGEAAALDGPGEDHRRLLPRAVPRICEGLVDGVRIVAVDDEHPGAEGHGTTCVGIQVPAQLGRTALTEAVDVDDGDEVRQAVIGGLVQRLPDGSFGQLAVAAEHPDPVGLPVQVLAGERDTDAVGQTLTERAGGDVDPGQHRGGVALQALPEPAIPGHQLVV